MDNTLSLAHTDTRVEIGTVLSFMKPIQELLVDWFRTDLIEGFKFRIGQSLQWKPGYEKQWRYLDFVVTASSVDNFREFVPENMDLPPSGSNNMFSVQLLGQGFTLDRDDIEVRLNHGLPWPPLADPFYQKGG